jgi:NADH-quinone oxidoreductase subunit N
MEFFLFLNNLSFFHVTIFVSGSYLLLSLCLGVRLGSDSNFAYPNLLNSFNTFSCIFLLATIYLFGFDFVSNDSLYFYNQNFLLLFLIISLFVLFASRDFLVYQTITKYEYDILFIFVVFSSICLCFADNFLLIYLAIELQSLALYVFATFNRTSEFTTEAGLKYFIFGSIISCFLLLGFAFIYLTYGSTSFEILFSIVNAKNDSFVFLGLVFIVIAFLFKVGSAPFHSWLCDVYDGSILSVTFLFAAMPKIILFSILTKLYFFTCFDHFEL